MISSNYISKLLFFIFLFSASSLAQAQSAEEIIGHYLAVDTDYFSAGPVTEEKLLFRGFQALAIGQDGAPHLLPATRNLPDSIRQIVYARLAEAAAGRFDWVKALGYAALVADSKNELFRARESKWAYFARFPQPNATVKGGLTRVEFDGYRVAGTIGGQASNQPVKFFLDSGAPVTLLSRRLADQLGLPLDSTAAGSVSIPARGINGARVFRTVIDSVTIGGATLRNLPADVIDTDRPIADGAELFLGFDALSGLLGGVVYGFADGSFSIYSRGSTPSTEEAPNLIMGSGYALLSYEADGRHFSGVIDTGSPFSYVYDRYWQPGAELTSRPVTHRGKLADTEYEFTLEYYDLPSKMGGRKIEALPLGLSRRGPVGAPFKVMSLLGTGLFSEGSLLLDFDHRVATFQRR